MLLRKKINQPILQRGRGFPTSQPRSKCAASSQPTRVRQATATLNLKTVVRITKRHEVFVIYRTSVLSLGLARPILLQGVQLKIV